MELQSDVAIVKQNIFDLDFEGWQKWLAGIGVKKYIVKQIFDWIYLKQVYNPLEWTNVAISTREIINQHFDYKLPEIVYSAVAADNTIKFLIKLADGKTIESVAIPSKKRMTLCLSSQVGCAIGCTFCHTATQGFTRNLKVHEVVGQFLVVNKFLQDNLDPAIHVNHITNIVYMGMGEPLHNFENMKTATEIFIDDQALRIGQRRVTLSTSGMVPQIEKLWDFPPINFTISLHSAIDKTRSTLMPINKVYDVQRLIAAIKTIPLKPRRMITFAYTLIDGVNNAQEDLDAIMNLLPKQVSKINLIPYNEFPGSEFKRQVRKTSHGFMIS
ncbi:MAG: 23S rRNA (adenine(2503)-C(2))-methyltransferase RlmN [Bacteriovoracaceae bacterium]